MITKVTKTEKVYEELKRKTKELAEFMILNDIKTGCFSVEKLNDLIVCDMSVTDDEGANKEFTYFFNNEAVEEDSKVIIQDCESETDVKEDINQDEESGADIKEDVSLDCEKETVQEIKNIEQVDNEEKADNKPIDNQISMGLDLDDNMPGKITMESGKVEHVYEDAAIVGEEKDILDCYEDVSGHEGNPEYHYEEDNVANAKNETVEQINNSKQNKKETQSRKIDFNQEFLFQKETIRRILGNSQVQENIKTA